MKMKQIPSILALVVLCIIGIYHVAAEEPSSTTTTTATTITSTTAATTPKPKIVIKDSELCKKCSCDVVKLQLDCSNKSLTTIFSADEWQILQNADVFFETIKLDNNDISIVTEFPTYPVKSLQLNFNKISQISPAAFENLTELTNLDLSYNKLMSKNLTPQVFKGMYAPDNYEPLKNLKSLNLASNELHTLKNDLFEHLPNLERLILSRNTFHIIDESTTIAIANLNSLKTLDMSYMELEQLPESIFHSPKELETLNLSGNLFHTLPSALIKATHLKNLTLDENPLNDLDNTNIFKSLGELEYLSISYLPDVTKIGPWALSDLQNLTTLVAVNNPHLSHIDKLAFTKNTSNPLIFDYPPLEKLILHNNNLTTIDSNWIVRWERIAEIDLRFNPWACDCSNSWLIHTLIKQINNTTPLRTHDITCATPSIWKKKPLLELTDNEQELLCRNINDSARSSLIWVGILVGVLVGIPLTLAALTIYKRGCFGLLKDRNAVVDRSLYSRANFPDDFHI